MHDESITTTSNTLKRRSIAYRVLLFAAIVLVLIPVSFLTLYMIPMKEREYKLPASLAPAQQLFRYAREDGIYIPSVTEVKVDRLYTYLKFKAKYGSRILQEFEVMKENQNNIGQSSTTNGHPGRVDIPDNQLIRDSLLYVALPAYIAGSEEAGYPADYGYEFEIGGVPPGLVDLLGTTIVSIDGHPSTLEEMKELVVSDSLHKIDLRTYEGNKVTKTTSLYGVFVNAHYTINQLWRFNDLMRFDLANVEGDSGGVATAYEVMLIKKDSYNKNGKFVITGAIDVDGNIRSVGGVKTKTYLAIKNSIPVMFVPDGLNFSEAVVMKELMKSDIAIVPMKKLSDIEAYWNNRKD